MSAGGVLGAGGPDLGFGVMDGVLDGAEMRVGATVLL